MLRRLAAILFTTIIALGVLAVSVLRAASVDYVFSQPSPQPISGTASSKEIKIDYFLPYPGKVLSDNALWYFKALRDRFWLVFTFHPGRKMDLLLLLADKRLAGSKTLFERQKPELGFSMLTKGEKYLEQAARLEIESRKEGIDTKSFLLRLAKAALKHQQIIGEIILIAPEDAKPGLVKAEDYAINVYKEARDAMNSLGMEPPKNPFESQ
jgi:hypothetical protein